MRKALELDTAQSAKFYTFLSVEKIGLPKEGDQLFKQNTFQQKLTSLKLHAS
jgi:hypothetical protein